jgi:SAM-dependent methyltransferase
MNNFEAYSKYYDLLYLNKDYQAEAQYVNNIIKIHNASAIHILELGCGSGNHAGYLCNEGYTVTGIERSESMIKEAEQKSIRNFKPILGDITSYKLDDKFDVAISLFHVISYLTKSEDLINCFNLVNKNLNTNGIFIFDVWYTPAVYFQKPETRIKRMSNENISVLRIAESDMVFNENLVNVNFEVIVKEKKSGAINIIKEIHPMRHFSFPEIDLLAKLCGFSIINAEEFLTSTKPSVNTWGVCFILKKIN